MITPKPRVTLRSPEFKIPAPYRAWCHLCSKGFFKIDDLVKHNKEFLSRHQQRKIK